MATILSETEAATVLRLSETDPNMLDLLPQVDRYITMATGRDWAADNPTRPEAKAAARMLLVMWHENPGMIGSVSTLNFGLSSALVQLEALALTLAGSGIPTEPLIMRSNPAEGADEIWIGICPTLAFSHAMAAAALTAVTLASAGGTVTATNSLDPTGKILTITPAASLAGDTAYTITITAAPDEYGRTLTKEIRFRTA